MLWALDFDRVQKLILSFESVIFKGEKEWLKESKQFYFTGFTEKCWLYLRRLSICDFAKTLF